MTSEIRYKCDVYSGVRQRSSFKPENEPFPNLRYVRKYWLSLDATLTLAENVVDDGDFLAKMRFIYVDSTNMCL